MELDLVIGGRRARTHVDSTSPISLIPKKLVKQLKLKKKTRVAKNRETVELIDNTVKLHGIYEIETELWDSVQKTNW